MIVFDWSLLYWISGLLLAIIWLVPTLQLALHVSEVADLTQPEWNPPPDLPLPSLTIVVPARNEEAEIEAALRSLLQLNYPQYQIVAVNDRSTDQTGAIMERLAAEPASAGKLRAIHVRDLPSGWLGKVHAMWLGAQHAGSDWLLFTDADCVFRSDCLSRALHYAIRTATDHLVLFPTVHMKTLGERMMISFPQTMSSFAMRLTLSAVQRMKPLALMSLCVWKWWTTSNWASPSRKRASGRMWSLAASLSACAGQ
jgi:cellulose synthase/poly-beta-1,6-N-acetylglucosamine synthase-like glycosyltransferase